VPSIYDLNQIAQVRPCELIHRSPEFLGAELQVGPAVVADNHCNRGFDLVLVKGAIEAESLYQRQQVPGFWRNAQPRMRCEHHPQERGSRPTRADDEEGPVEKHSVSDGDSELDEEPPHHKSPREIRPISPPKKKDKARAVSPAKPRAKSPQRSNSPLKSTPSSPKGQDKGHETSSTEEDSEELFESDEELDEELAARRKALGISKTHRKLRKLLGPTVDPARDKDARQFATQPAHVKQYKLNKHFGEQVAISKEEEDDPLEASNDNKEPKSNKLLFKFFGSKEAVAKPPPATDTSDKKKRK